MDYSSLPVRPDRVPDSFNFAKDIVDYWAISNPSQPALQWTDQSLTTCKTYTYQHFSRQSHRIASLFASLSVSQGETVVLILPRIPEWWEIATACLRAGIIVCPCTTLLVDKDIKYRLQVSHAAVFIGDPTSVSKVQRVRGKCPKLRMILQIGGGSTSMPGVLSFNDALSHISNSALFPTTNSLTSNSPALTFFTSGTTGPPKMVLHTQSSYPLAHALTGVHWLNLSPSSLYWNLSEQGWAKASWSFFATWNCGGTLFVHDERQAFDPIRTLQVLNKFPITTLCAPPTVYRQLVLDQYAKVFASPQGKPRSLVHACGAGEPLNESVIRKWKQMTNGMEIFDGYGQTETVLLCANQQTNRLRFGSMGKPLPGVPVMIIDTDGQEASSNTEGDIAVEVQQPHNQFYGLFKGYIDMSTGAINQKIKTFANGRKFYLTGDRARTDDDGYFWFVGRGDDVINSSGYRIGPFEVESTLKLHPSVVESAVVGSPDPDRDEVVKAFIVLTSEASASASSVAKTVSLVKELQHFCKNHAAPYKYPRKVEFVDASFLPKTISGKIKRGDLKKLERQKYQEENHNKARLLSKM